MDQHVGLLVVHGIGEQKRFETARQVARALLAGLQERGGARFSLIDRASDPAGMPMNCPRIDRDGSPFTIACQADGSDERTYVHLHEVWWSDLGAPATLGEQLRFWLWGLGQWYARVVWRSHFTGKPSNTDLLMDPPTRFRDVRDDARHTKPRPFARVILFLSALYALLTLFSWEAVKRAFAWLSPVAGSPAILTSYVGDVRIYTQGPGKGGGNITDVGQPWRATIRRRMVSQLVAMAERDYDRWYVLAHSLGSVVAYNGLQEPAWNLPNYLDPAQVARLRAATAPAGLWQDGAPPPGEVVPDLARMMPRRPVWLGAHERVSRANLFRNFRGLVTYGSPLDKFAALWPRIVPVNKDRDVFPPEADWINLSDATDPVGAEIEAFAEGWRTGTPAERSPRNIRVRASPFFLLAHIRYFGLPSRRRGDHPESRALVDVLFPRAGGAAPRLDDAFAAVGAHYGSPAARMALAVGWIVLLGAALLAATSWLALVLRGLGDGLFAAATHWLRGHAPDGFDPAAPERVWHAAIGWLGALPVPGFRGTMATTLLIAVTVVAAAGGWCHRGDG